MDDWKAMILAWICTIAVVIGGLISVFVFDNGVIILMSGLAAMFLVFGILIITGHGYGLIAGLNMMDEEERSEYNLPKIYRAVGVCMLLWSASFVSFMFDRTFFIVMVIISTGSVLLVLWYVPRCKKNRSSHCEGPLSVTRAAESV